MAENEAEAPQDLRAFIEENSPDEYTDQFGEGSAAFDVILRRVDKPSLNALQKSCTTTRRTRQGDVTETNEAKFRSGLMDLALVGWDRLTYKKVLIATGRKATNLNGLANKPVAFSRPNALTMMEKAVGMVDGELRSFELFVLDRATKIADAVEREERASGEG